MESHRPLSGPTVAIIGAGFGGITAAISLKEKLGFENFIILEKASDVGGTWRDNVYPGCSSDVSIHFYSLSTDLKYDWDNTCEFQPNILDYIKDIVQKHDLRRYMVFNTQVVAAEWETLLQAYTITTKDAKTGVSGTLTAQIIISANGILHVPRMPTIPGLDSFKGPVMHSAKWDKSLDLRGKRVAVIGNGSTGFLKSWHIPKLEGIQVTQFYRTRNWHLPGLGKPISSGMKWTFKHIPFASRLFRWMLFWIFELCYILLFKSVAMRGPFTKLAKIFMRSTAPKEYHDILIPAFPVGCRRIVHDSGYLAALHRPNVTVTETGIASVHPEGIVTSDGKNLPFDVIICATGFITDKFPYHLGGRESTIQEYNDSHGGPNAYLGTTVPGFPNFYMISGPNTATGYTSVLFFTEAQVGYIMNLIKPVLDKKVSSFETTSEANEAYNKNIQKKLKDTVWTFCGSWYRVGGNGRNVSIFPGSAIVFWWWCQSVNWSHYKVVGLNGGMKSMQKRNSMQHLTIIIGMGLAVLYALQFAN